MNKPPIFILWDASFVWGLIALRGLRQLKLNCSLVSSKDIAQGRLGGKQGRHAMLLAPGGSARQKYSSLGEKGKKTLLEWLAAGGHYLGFCGGAGLALNEPDGLGICPLRRDVYPNRLFHLLSGHMLAETVDGPKALPVWWPGKFPDTPRAGVEWLATVSRPEADLRLADMPFARLPANLLESLEKKAGNGGRLFPSGHPLMLAGSFGKGDYILSYAHLETPDSPAANQWLAELLKDFGSCAADRLPAWPIWQGENDAMQADGAGSRAFTCQMRRALQSLREFCALGIELDFFYRRNSWLCGWRAGFPGMSVNNLAACLASLADYPEDAPPPSSWERSAPLFQALTTRFFTEAPRLLWQVRIARAVSGFSGKAAAEEPELAEIFGRPMPGGGLVEDISRLCAQYIYEAQDNLFRS